VAVKTIALSQGYIAKVSNKDYARLLEGTKWFADVVRRKDGSIRTVYAVRNATIGRNKRVTQFMHGFITGLTGVDHKDGDGLNNLRSNLRKATKEQNGANRKPNLSKTSKYKGVWFCKSRHLFSAAIQVNNVTTYLGSWITEKSAALAYDKEAIKAWGNFARLNFPRTG
jgi:uncharacterized protein YqhQ